MSPAEAAAFLDGMRAAVTTLREVASDPRMLPQGRSVLLGAAGGIQNTIDRTARELGS